LDALPDAQAETVLAEVVSENPKPWVMCFAARLVVTSAKSTAEMRKTAESWSLTAASSDALQLWELYKEIAQFSCNEFTAAVDWSSLTPTQRLAVCWFHAAQIARTVIDGQVDIEPFVEILRNHRRASPRIIVEDVVGFAGDNADPRQTPTDRLRLFELAELLLHFQGTAGRNETKILDAIRSLLIDRLDGQEHPRLTAAHNGLASRDLLGSIFSSDFSQQIGEIVEGSAVLCGEGLRTMLTDLLNGEEGSTNFEFAWTMLRISSGDAALPSGLAELAHARSTQFSFLGDVADVAARRHRLLTFTILAANNGWLDKREMVDAASHELYSLDLPSCETDTLYYEQSFWRSRMEATPSDLVHHLARAIESRARRAADAEFPKTLLRTLATSLSGTQAEPFVDSLAAIKCQ
jgi:hypothetical protein